ncbi:hypothetical protein [Vibrio sp. LaRot3]|uniref:hypothetical protein n=1 Tax=Vibrio sp. LaRot3 TaxID=2998829 RepID=UPI0022CE014D|nr:hypothetical protein [Vibrio sp. LaRot3]MDA0149856.1 hypothetical protein [Vibrio sp. LaRot3]
MNIFALIAAIILDDHIKAYFGYTYRLFVDPFDLGLFIVDIAIFVVVYVCFTFLFEQVKKWLIKMRSD